MEKKPESSNIENASESDEKSSSLSRHDVPETSIVQASLNMEDNIKERIVIHFMVESESSNTKNFSDETLSSFFTLKHDAPETYIEKASNLEAYDSQPSQSDITEEQPKSTNVEKNNEFDGKSSSPSILSHDVPKTSIEQIPSNPEDFISQPSQSDITEEQPKSTNVEKDNEFDEKSSSPSIPSHDVPKTSIEETLSNQEVFIGNSLHSYFLSCLKKQNESSNIDNSSKFTKLSMPNYSRIMVSSELFNDNQFSQECIQKNKSDNKSNENQDERGLSNSDSYAAIKEQQITSKYDLKLKFSCLQECNEKNKSDTKSTDNQYKKEEKHPLIVDNTKFPLGQLFTRPPLTKDDFMKNIFPKRTTTGEAQKDDFVKDILPKLTTTGEAEKDEKPKKLRCKIKRRPKNSSKFSLSCLFSFIIPSILILSLCIFPYLYKFYIHSGLVRMDKNDSTFATAVVELEEGILNHDATIGALSEYLERDKPLLKVIALSGDTSVDKPYTVNIIKKRLRNKGSTNDCLSSLPRFVVLENLQAEHSTVVTDYMKTYQEEYGNREFLILAAYKIEQIDNNLTHADINHVINTVKDTFIKANIMVKIIPFTPLTEDILEKYIL
ncbi:TRIO and F-actin-binding protein-like [Cataglyphis hispanica]|uniref:TRIO and F-actin-binding protein-like n=1 Tax=Cataglyphis hispanica TaxID=1086592 RepID=UPI002180464D|nr:TRIO and F-actin-binding protein-like [Cataglyphis hispanica]